MINASKMLLHFISMQEDKTRLSKRWNISRQTLYSIIDGGDVGSETIANILNDTGFDFEKAFEVKEAK